MKLPLKLAGWAPRLTRRQRVVRNLAAVVIALFLTWVILDFPAPTLGIAARWEAAQYGLPAPEVLYCSDGAGGDGILQWEDGRLALTRCDSGTLSWSLGDFYFTEPEDGGALLVPDMYGYKPAYMVYFWTERTDAVRAEASLRLQTEVNVKITDSDGSSEEGHYDWDETYEMDFAALRSRSNLTRTISGSRRRRREARSRSFPGLPRPTAAPTGRRTLPYPFMTRTARSWIPGRKSCTTI